MATSTPVMLPRKPSQAPDTSGDKTGIHTQDAASRFHASLNIPVSTVPNLSIAIASAPSEDAYTSSTMAKTQTPAERRDHPSTEGFTSGEQGNMAINNRMIVTSVPVRSRSKKRRHVRQPSTKQVGKLLECPFGRCQFRSQVELILHDHMADVHEWNRELSVEACLEYSRKRRAEKASRRAAAATAAAAAAGATFACETTPTRPGEMHHQTTGTRFPVNHESQVSTSPALFVSRERPGTSRLEQGHMETSTMPARTARSTPIADVSAPASVCPTAFPPFRSELAIRSTHRKGQVDESGPMADAVTGRPATGFRSPDVNIAGHWGGPLSGALGPGLGLLGLGLSSGSRPGFGRPWAWSGMGMGAGLEGRSGSRNIGLADPVGEDAALLALLRECTEDII